MTFSWIVKTGISVAAVEMAMFGHLKVWETLTGLRVIPGTLNLSLLKPFDLSLLKYLSFSKVGWDFDPSTQGFDFNGDIGMHYGLITIAGKYSGALVFWSWVPELSTRPELISQVHLRSTMGLKDGDTVEFSLFAV